MDRDRNKANYPKTGYLVIRLSLISLIKAVLSFKTMEDRGERTFHGRKTSKELGGV